MAHIAKAIQQNKVVVDFQDSKPWPRFTPEDRLKLYRKCGAPCFAKAIRATAEQILKNPKDTLQFPVCRVHPSKSRTCKVSAAGLLAAQRRAILTKKYPEIQKQTAQLIAKLGTTKKARKEMEIQRVIVGETPLPNGKYLLTIVYTDKVKKQVPYTKGHILRNYGEYLSKATHKRLSG